MSWRASCGASVAGRCLVERVLRVAEINLGAFHIGVELAPAPRIVRVVKAHRLLEPISLAARIGGALLGAVEGVTLARLTSGPGRY